LIYVTRHLAIVSAYNEDGAVAGAIADIRVHNQYALERGYDAPR
jgi:hypothetical protein